MGRQRAAIGLGSNVGDRHAHIEEALLDIAGLGDPVATSSLYETAPIGAPVGGPEQGPYLNAVAVIDTTVSPLGLLAELRDIEVAHGRERRERWGPRTLDLDLLLYGRESIGVPGLTVPHPRMLERRFVLEPLLEAWPDASLPDGRRLDGWSLSVADQDVTRL